MRPVSYFFLLLCLTIPVHAQTPSSEPYANQLDFLLGDWQYETAGFRGTATYEKSDASGVITERIDGVAGGQAFVGLSMFVFADEASGIVKQEWFDSLGNHLSPRITTGSYEPADSPVPIAEFTHQGQRFRHIWYEITDERFMTDLLVADESGTFNVVRHMPYVRM